MMLQSDNQKLISMATKVSDFHFIEEIHIDKFKNVVLVVLIAYQFK